jgi:hypothetical protein
MKNIIETFALFLMLIGLTTASGFLVGSISPHGMAGFIYSSVVLGIVGGIVFSAFFVINPTIHSRTYIGGVVGLACGVLSFPVSTVIAERSLYFPHDFFQLILLAYLCALGASLGWLIVVVQRRMKRSN